MSRNESKRIETVWNGREWFGMGENGLEWEKGARDVYRRTRCEFKSDHNYATVNRGRSNELVVEGWRRVLAVQ